MSEKLSLSNELASALKYNDIEIPVHITENLNKELRPYQITALKHYLLQRKNPQTNHLMFNMATGSGKTLMMAALMLDLFKQGYTKFVFFVNATAILEKTKANFCDKASSKYLFSEKILIDGKEVAVQTVENFEECDENAINIYFSTIQGLFSLFRNERENSLTLDDLANHEIVFIADEAHHLNSETKKKLTDTESNIKASWESVMKSAFHAHEKNLMLEFTATIPKEKAVLDKYQDKIVFEFDLKAFCKGGFSKRIFLVKYDSVELKDRFLGACILSVFRQELARKHGIKLKPVTLFKSETIASSKDNQALFIEMIEHLSDDEIISFYKNLSGDNQLFSIAKDFFVQELGENFTPTLAKLIQTAFKKAFLFNANDDVEKNQIKLNTLEDDDNEIRAIFAVDKLNEGWDVLNLFDIVRLGGKKVSPKTTTAEVQLIGRGARYFPFEDKDLFDDKARKFVRKFDNDGNHKMASLEILSYHSFNDVAFITDLQKGMRESGVLFDDDKEKIILKPSKHGKAVQEENKIYYAKNQRIKKGDIFDYAYSPEEIKYAIKKIDVPYFSHAVNETEISFEETGEKQHFSGSLKLNQKVSYGVFLKALNQLNISFADIRDFYPCERKADFYQEFGEIELLFDKRQEFSPQNQLAIAKFVLQNFKELKEKTKQEYKVEPFRAYEMSGLGERVIYRDKNKVKDSPYEWLYYDKYSFDSELENEFLQFIEARKEQIDATFCEWFVVRNDGFDEFKIYDNREELINGEKNPSYAAGFEPDFIFFGKKDENSNYLSVQCFFEPKGGHLGGENGGKDNWKEAFLSEIDGMKFDKVLSEKGTATQLNLEFGVMAFPFFLGKQFDNQKFEEKFAKVFDEK